MSSLVNLRTRTRTTYMKIDPNAKVRDNPTLDFFINEAYNKVQRKGNYQRKECEQFATLDIDGSTMYDMPDDFVRVEDDGMLVSTMTIGKTTRNQVLRLKSNTGTPTAYYIYDGKIGFYPVADAGLDIQMIYRKKLPKITDAQDSILPEDYDEAICLYASYLAMLSVEKQAKANMLMLQFNDCINGLFGMDMYDDESLTFSSQRGDNWYRDNVL
jgi:hypothetical protein